MAVLSIDVSLIITTYNWPQALKMTLQSVLEQSRFPDELIVADDGSGTETAQVVSNTLRPSQLKWVHVWHEDRGVRQSRIKNLAIRHSSGTYLIFIDHDVVLHPEFIADHLSMAGKGFFLQGKRVLLPPRYTKELLNKGFFVCPTIWMGGLGNRKNAFHLPLLGKLLAIPKASETSLRGCNLSMYRSNFLEVDGFDERFDGSWGREDSDICYRLFHKGIHVKNLWCMALQYHLSHSVTGNWEKERLDGELLRNVKEKRNKAIQGFSRLSQEGVVIASSTL
ncbi:MAG: glycosyltransferase [Deltaproteobacteria bacterium]|nr:glycosyltransferase [Deltaproteobacteria bacterium]